MSAPPRPRGRGSEHCRGSCTGSRGLRGPDLCPETPDLTTAAASPGPRPPARLRSPPSPPLASRYGFSMAATAPSCTERMREGVPGLGEGRHGSRAEPWCAGSVRPEPRGRLAARDGCGGSARACAPMASTPPTFPTAAAGVGSSGSGLTSIRAAPCCGPGRHAGPGCGTAGRASPSGRVRSGVVRSICRVNQEELRGSSNPLNCFYSPVRLGHPRSLPSTKFTTSFFL